MIPFWTCGKIMISLIEKCRKFSNVKCDLSRTIWQNYNSFCGKVMGKVTNGSSDFIMLKKAIALTQDL